MHLHSLIKELDSSITVNGPGDVEVLGVCEDSRQVKPGDVFVARPGTRCDGARFVGDAAARGAVAVVSARPIADCPLPQVLVGDIAQAASRLAHILLGRPSQRLGLIGITGTNGKTTTAYLVRHILLRAGRRCGLISTVETDDGNTVRRSDMTTPPPVQTAKLLSDMCANGCQWCVMEVSSHALDQGRVAGAHFAAAAFTNLTRDHLDYHVSMRAYASAKAKLFEGLDESDVAVVNAQDRWSRRMVRSCRAQVVRFGLGRAGEYRAARVEASAAGTRFVLIGPDGQAPVQMPLIGRHNVANALAAAAITGRVCGLSVAQIAASLLDAGGAPGRLQPVNAGQPFAVFVDYAHTDDGIRNVLNALRPLTAGRLRIVFGCGGDRDRGKRPRMARAAEELADVVYLTSDNPRSEDPMDIIREVVAGFSADAQITGFSRSANAAWRLPGGISKPVIVEPDRRLAIHRALTDAAAGDVVVIAGKGHEDYQIVGSVRHHFDDYEEALAFLRSRAA